MTRTCTYCHTPLPAPPLPYTLLWVCTPDGTEVEPVCCDCYFARGLFVWGRQHISEQRYHEGHPQGRAADEAWFLEWADGIPQRNPRETDDGRFEPTGEDGWT